MIKVGINLCVVIIAIIATLMLVDILSRTRMYKETRVFDTRGVVVDKMDHATYLSRHLFQTTQRNQRRLSGSPSTSPLLSPFLAVPRPLPPPSSFLSCFPVRFFSFLTSSVERGWRVAVDSRFKWVWRIAIARITLCFRDVRLRFP